jgi:hypothetical protein
MKFKEWLIENMWGNTPARTRKPSDGLVGKSSPSSNGAAAGAGAAPPMQQKMKKK